MKNKQEKTNVMRILDQKKIPYESRTYPHGEEAVDGAEVARLLGQNPGFPGPMLGFRLADSPFRCEHRMVLPQKASPEQYQQKQCDNGPAEGALFLGAMEFPHSITSSQGRGTVSWKVVP